MKNKMINDIKAAVMLIIAENLIALRYAFKLVINSFSKSSGVRRQDITK